MLGDPFAVCSLVYGIPVETRPPGDFGDGGNLVTQSASEHYFSETLRNLLSR